MNTAQHQDQFFDIVFRVSGREINLLAALMHSVVNGELTNALQLIGCKSNHKFLAAALARVFFFHECKPQEIKQKGYTKLQEITANVINGLLDCGDIRHTQEYQRVISKVYTSRGIKDPWQHL